MKWSIHNMGISTENMQRTEKRTDDCAKLPIFLASNEARYITGADIVVDGGRMLALKGTEE